MKDILISQVLPERHPLKRIRGLTAGHIHLGIIDLQQGGSRIDYPEILILVNEVFEDGAPPLILVDFVNVKLRYSPLVKEFNQILQLMSPEPVVVQGDVERIIRIAVFLLDPLQKHGGFTYATLSLDTDDAGVPVNLGIKVALEIQRNLGEFTVVKLNNGANICQFHISIFLAQIYKTLLEKRNYYEKTLLEK